jgi:hypothetical protein
MDSATTTGAEKHEGRRGNRVEAIVSPELSRAIRVYAATNRTTVSALIVAALLNTLENDR